MSNPRPRQNNAGLSGTSMTLIVIGIMMFLTGAFMWMISGVMIESLSEEEELTKDQADILEVLIAFEPKFLLLGLLGFALVMIAVITAIMPGRS